MILKISGSDGHVSASWKLHYYQWVMQLFEQYNISEGACQFALAALEQVDDLGLGGDGFERDSSNESTTTIKGRLWANVFKFTLDLNLLNDAYCAIISNPDEESKYICLRRFVFVLYECGAIKVLLYIPLFVCSSYSASVQCHACFVMACIWLLTSLSKAQCLMSSFDAIDSILRTKIIKEFSKARIDIYFCLKIKGVEAK